MSEKARRWILAQYVKSGGPTPALRKLYHDYLWRKGAAQSVRADELEDILAELDRCANSGEQSWLSKIGRHGQWLRVHRKEILAALRS